MGLFSEMVIWCHVVDVVDLFHRKLILHTITFFYFNTNLTFPYTSIRSPVIQNASVAEIVKLFYIVIYVLAKGARVQ